MHYVHKIAQICNFSNEKINVYNSSKFPAIPGGIITVCAVA